MSLDRVGGRVASQVTRSRPALLLCLSLAWVLTLPGCSGCRQDESSAKAKDDKAKKKKEQKPYEFTNFEVVPSDDSLPRNFVKPGHAVAASLSAVSNVADLRAEVESQVTDANGAPVPMAGTTYHLLNVRPAVLPKGQRKMLEFTYFIPHEAGENSGLFLRHRLLLARSKNLLWNGEAEPTGPMPSYQYVFVVLSDNPNAYGYVKQLESVRPFYDQITDAQSALVYYRVVLPAFKDHVPLPSHPFAWSSIAYVLWDGAFADRLTADQQRAMLGWLHWGGQLIVSGPGSLGQLAGSFLGPYLPATDDGAVELASDALQPLNEYWSLPLAKTQVRQTLDVVATSRLVGVRLHPKADAAELTGTGQLAVERRVGRGRIVVTSFSLSTPDVVNWRSYDSFFNNGLLRRPRRVFVSRQLGAVETRWAEYPALQRDPLMVTATRYFTRDVGSARAAAGTADADVDWHVDGSEANRAGGVASWNDASGPAAAAHQALQDAAGISIPQASFVLGILVIYLVVLVPINWAFWRLLRRIEWAWATAPVIAIVGAVAVIRLAQLDIGFVRSRTEIAVAEMHAGHPDAHVTRYTALYSSLSTSYELQFEDPSALARPFPPTPPPARSWPVTSYRDEGIRLSGFQVASNTTGFIHSEQMCDLGGSIQLAGDASEQWSLENKTALNLQHVELLYASPRGVMSSYWRELAAGAVERVALAPHADDAESADAPTPQASDGEINVRSIAKLAARGSVLRPGDARLIAWTDDPVPGLTIAPQASQSRIRTLVLVHLRYGPLPPARPDVNLRIDVQETRAQPDDIDVQPEDLLQAPHGSESQ
jgi:hypothetical protein